MPEVIIRLLDPSGRYPDYPLVAAGHRLHVDRTVAWIATLPSKHAPERPEVAWLRPEEVPIFAAVSLVEPDPWNNGWLWLAPQSTDHVLPLPTGVTELQTDDAIDFLTTSAAALRGAWSTRISSNPRPYELVGLGSPSTCQTLIESIDLSDNLLLRGLERFVTANNLSRQPFFIEEAGLAAIISLEAALEHIRLWLEESLKVHRSIADALSYVEAAFPRGTNLVQYLKELYDLRTMAVHPLSRFGFHWAPPMYVDDCFECLALLVTLYRHILLGELPAEDAA